MPNVKYYSDSNQYHLTSIGQEGFDVPDELWKEYVYQRTQRFYLGPYYKSLRAIEKYDPQRKILREK